MKTFYLNKHNGQITNKSMVAKNINELMDGRWEINIKDASQRTLPQNNWFHVVLPLIQKGLQDIGYTEVKTPDDAKAVVKALFFKKKISNGSDEIEIIEGTSSQTKINFAAKATEIIDWAASYLGIQIAPPSAQTGLYAVFMEAEHDEETKSTIVKR